MVPGLLLLALLLGPGGTAGAIHAQRPAPALTVTTDVGDIVLEPRFSGQGTSAIERAGELSTFEYELPPVDAVPAAGRIDSFTVPPEMSAGLLPALALLIAPATGPVRVYNLPTWVKRLPDGVARLGSQDLLPQRLGAVLRRILGNEKPTSVFVGVVWIEKDTRRLTLAPIRLALPQ